MNEPISLTHHQAHAVAERAERVLRLGKQRGTGLTGQERVVVTIGNPYYTERNPALHGLYLHVEGRAGAPVPLFAKDLGYERNFEATRLPARDEDGHVQHPDMDGIGWDEFDMGPQLRALGWVSTTVGFEDDADHDMRERYSESNSPDCSYWTPSRPAGDGWLLAAIYDTEDGPVALYVRSADGVKATHAHLTDERIYELAKQHLSERGHELIWKNDPEYAKACDLPKDARWSTANVSPEQTMAFARAIEAHVGGVKGTAFHLQTKAGVMHCELCGFVFPKAFGAWTDDPKVYAKPPRQYAPCTSGVDVPRKITSVAEFCAEAERIGLTAEALAEALSKRPEFADCLPTPGVALPRTDELVEAVAKAIYSQWVAAPGYVRWVEGGNSLNQDDARRLARKALEEAGIDGVDAVHGQSNEPADADDPSIEDINAARDLLRLGPL